MSVLKLKTAPASEPVDLDELKNYLRIDSAFEDTLLASLILAARAHIESLCGPLITQAWEQFEADWPDGDVLQIGKPRLQSVSSVTYSDLSLAESTLDAGSYAVNTENEYSPSIVLRDGEEWPSDELFPSNPICIEFVCGYGDDSTSIPEPIRIALLMLCSHWYENREPVHVGSGQASPLPFAIEALLANYRVWGM